MDAKIVANAAPSRTISGVKRQIGILIDARQEEGLSSRIIYHIQLRKRKINIKDVESFEGMMRGIGTTREFSFALLTGRQQRKPAPSNQLR